MILVKQAIPALSSFLTFKYRSLGLLLAVVSCKLVILLVDSEPLFFGDSKGYLLTAATGFIPADRSFLYGYLLGALTGLGGDIQSVVFFQTLLGVGTALITAIILRRGFGVNWWLTFSSAIVCALAPNQLVFERYVMTEAVSLFLFSAFLLAVIHYISRPAISGLVFIQVLGTVLIAFRLSFLPVVVIGGLGAPLAGWLRRSNQFQFRKLVGQTTMSVLLLIALHGSYCSVNGAVSGRRAAYLHANGFFLFAAWISVIQPQDASTAKVRELLAEPLTFEGEYDSLFYRNHILWAPEGKVSRLKRLFTDPLVANEEALAISRRALLRDPVGVFTVVLNTYLSLWNGNHYRALIEYDSPAGLLRLDAELAQLLRGHFHYDPLTPQKGDTIIQGVYKRLRGWNLLALLSPMLLIIAAVLSPRIGRIRIGMLALLAGILLFTVCAFGQLPSFRLLHHLNWMSLLGITLLVGQVKAGKHDPTGGRKGDGRTG
jgi:hypothetical protein